MSENKQTQQTENQINFERRRYGSTTYCWATVTAEDGSKLDLGDPWPAANWPKDVLAATARAALAKHIGDELSYATASATAAEAQVRHLMRANTTQQQAKTQ